MTAPRRSVQWVIAAALGALTVAAYAPFHLFPLPLLSFALLFLLWQQAASARDAALLGFAFGLGWFGVGVSWVYISLNVFGAMPSSLAAAVTLLFCAYLALHPAAAGYLSRRFALPPALNWILFVPAVFTLFEWLRGWLWTGFPWLNPGYSQVPSSPLAGYAPVLGVHGVALLLFCTAGALCWAWITKPWQQWRSHWRWPAALLAIWLAGAGLKAVAWTEPTGSKVSVSLLQGNIAQDLKWRSDQLRDTLLRYLELVRSSDSQLIILPETALPLFLRDVPPEYLEALAEHARQHRSDVLVGVPERLPNGDYYNSVVSFGSSPQQTYRKNHLVPFGEFIPLRPLLGELVSRLAIPLQDFARGAPDQQPLAVAGERVAINICYEDAFGEEIIRQLPQATLLVNVSNVAWFGRSIAPQQHLQIAQMRALETGRYMLRATNTGMTAVVNPQGRVEAVAPEFTRTVLTHTVAGMQGATPFVRWGNGAALGLCLIAIAAAFLLRKRARR
ncbi:MAG: apolipoprotein N-acyltransferase [Burkholderiales bacterium]|nr:apolipoprotein N-acyltransferase [Burkholderiales bacterium]